MVLRLAVAVLARAQRVRDALERVDKGARAVVGGVDLCGEEGKKGSVAPISFLSALADTKMSVPGRIERPPNFFASRRSPDRPDEYALLRGAMHKEAGRWGGRRKHSLRAGRVVVAAWPTPNPHPLPPPTLYVVPVRQCGVSLQR